MSHKATGWALCIVLGLSGCATLPGKEPDLLIVVHTIEARLFGQDATYVRIEKRDGKYFCEGKLIPEERVTAFFAAVQIVDDGPMSFSNLGITQSWLDQNAELAFDEYFKDRTHSILPSQKELFISRFRSSSAVGKAVDAYFNSYWTDDWPNAHVEIYERNSGRAIVVESSDLHDYMIPWWITEKGVGRRSFNANMGRTLGALLPDDAQLKARISGIDFRRHLSHSLYGQMWQEWEKLKKNRNPSSR